MPDAASNTTRDRISEVAARMFAERGYHGTSIGDLAAEVGIQKASMYSHIAGKHDLLAEIALAGAEAFHAALDAVPGEADPADRLRLALGAHLNVVHRQLDVATVWLHEWRYLVDESRTIFLVERRRYQTRIRQLFAAAVEAGALDADLDLDRAVLVFLSVGNWAYTWMAPETRVAHESDALWVLLLDGLRAR